MHVSDDMHLFYLIGKSYDVKNAAGNDNRSEGSVKLYFELYLDSLLFSDLFLNLYLLLLVQKIRRYAATYPRILLAAGYGAAVTGIFVTFPLGVSWWWKLLPGLLIEGIGMLAIAFSLKGIRSCIWMLVTLTGAGFYLGGCILFFKSFLRAGLFQGTFGTILAGAAALGAGLAVLKRLQSGKQDICRAVLYRESGSIQVNALVDTGNTLTEPISGRPVSVLDQELLCRLFGGNLPSYYRVVPFCSIGKKRGYLKCFEIPRMDVEYAEQIHRLTGVLVACSEEYCGTKTVGMILNPRIIESMCEKGKENDF